MSERMAEQIADNLEIIGDVLGEISQTLRELLDQSAQPTDKELIADDPNDPNYDLFN